MLSPMCSQSLMISQITAPFTSYELVTQKCARRFTVIYTAVASTIIQTDHETTQSVLQSEATVIMQLFHSLAWCLIGITKELRQ